MIQQRSVTRHQLFKMAHRLSAQQSLEIRKLRIIHYECTSLAEKLINKYKFLLLYVVGHTYVTMVSYWYVVVHTIYLYLLQKQPQDMVFMSSAAIYIVTKMISLWTLFDADNQLNQQIRIFQYQCFVKPVKLTVAGLFNLDTNFLQTSLAAALAYVVLMMQYTVDTKQPENRLSNTTSTEDPTFVTSSTPMSR